jgi:hypothetical protein
LAKSWTKWILIFPPVIIIGKYEDTTKTKYMTGFMDKSIAKFNQNELD